MATRTAKLRIELDGEKQYKQALSELNKGNQVLASEMRKLSAEYAGNEKSVEALTKKGDILQRQLLQQKDKVQTLREALKNAANQYGEADKRTQEWQIKLNDAEAAQFKLEHAIDENNKALKGQGTEMISLGDAVGELAGKLGIQLPDGALKALNSMQGMSAGSVAALGAVAAGVTAVIKLVKELNSMTLEAAARADDFLTESTKTGLSPEELQAFRYASPFIDVSTDTMASAFSRMPKTIMQAQQQLDSFAESQRKARESGKEFTGGLGEQAQAFSDLGISLVDASGKIRDYHDIVWEALASIGEMGDTTESAAIANALFGKSYADLKPLMENAEEAQRLMNEAVSEGFVLSNENLEILGSVDDAFQKYTLTVEKNKNLIAVEWAPATKAAYETLSDLINKAGRTLVDSGLVSNFAALVESTLGLVEAGANLIDMLPGWINPIESVADAFKGLAIVMATVADTVNLISGLMPWNWGSGMATTALGWNIDKGQMSNLQQLKYGGGTVYNATGNANWRGGLTWVGENGPELVSLPRGSRIYNNQESREAVAGDTNIYINVNGIKQLSEVVDWYNSRRVRGRMC